MVMALLQLTASALLRPRVLLLASGAPQKHLSPLLAMTSLVALLAGLLPAGLLPLSVAQQLLPLLAGL